MTRSIALTIITCIGLLTCTLLTGCGGGSYSPMWSVMQNGTILQIGYGQGDDYPQYAALHLDSGYLRLVPNREASWGTSIVLLPSFWSDGAYYQGAPISCSYEQQGDQLALSIESEIGGLSVQGTVTLTPPDEDMLEATVSMQASGQVPVDSRPGEAFKPVMLSSMHISSDQWDAQSAFVGSTGYAIPGSGWILDPPATGTVFGLLGGTSQWKTNAPTIEIAFDRSLQVTGWVTDSTDPNDDNVGFWCAGDTVLSSWSYTATAKP